MHIVILAMGTRGDVQPTLALSKGLQAAGHTVTLVAGRNFADWIESHGVHYGLMDVDMQALMGSAEGQEWSDRGNNPMVQLRNMKRLMDAHAPQITGDLLNLSRDADVLVGGATTDSFAYTIAQKRDILHISAMLQPMRPTKYGVSTLMPFLGRGQGTIALNRQITRVSLRFMWTVARDATNTLRAQSGLPLMTARDYVQMCVDVPTVQGYSEHVSPHSDDYPDHVYTTGYWFLDDDADWTPPEDLQAFLDAGEKPVYIGFGSMSNRDPEATTRMILDALRQTGKRAVIAKGWAGLTDSDIPESVYMLESAPHRWLFPRMAAVVHHGGAGTTAAGLCAGVPNFIIPSMADQPYWGRRVYELGVGPKPVQRPKITAQKLADAIQQMTSDTAMQQRALTLGQKLVAEDGVANAVKAFETIIANRISVPGTPATEH